MPSIRSGFGSDFVLKNENIGIGSTTPTSALDVAGAIKGNFVITGVATLTSYGGFVAQNQHINKASSIGFATVGLQTGAGIITSVQYYETETGFTDLGGVHHGDDQKFNTLSEDLIIDDGQILNITSIDMVGVTTIGEYDPHSHESYVCAGSLEQVSVTDHFSVPSGGINDRKDNPIEGTVRFNDDLNTLEFFNGNEWKQFTYNQGQSGRGVFGGGYRTPTDTADIESLNLSSGGASVMFGDLTDERTQLGAASSSIRGLFAGGDPGPSNSDVIEYITIASGGNGIDFGNLISAGRLPAAASSSTRAIFAGEAASNVISYVEINTTGNALDFGDITTASGAKGTATSSPTRFVYASGNSPNPQIIEYGTISSKGNTLTFGDLTYGGSFRKPRATSNGIRGIFTGGYQNTSPYPGLKDICYITMATTGNAVNFGELTIQRHSALCTSSQIKSIHAGGETDASGSGTLLSSIDTIDYASSGNAVDFGNLSEPTSNGHALSDSHGGLGGF